jgi:hypothetical protein
LDENKCTNKQAESLCVIAYPSLKIALAHASEKVKEPYLRK